MEKEKRVKLLKDFKKLGFELAFLHTETGAGLYCVAELTNQNPAIGPLTIDLKKLSITNKEFQDIFF